MAVQTGVVTLTGKVGQHIFYRRNGKNFSRSAASSHNLSEASKKTAADFGVASSATALIRKTFAPLLDKYADARLIDRLRSAVVQVVHTGPPELKGRRQVTDGDVAILKSLQFNTYTRLERLLPAMPEVKIFGAERLDIRLPAMEEGRFHYPDRAYQACIDLMCGIFHFDKKNAGFVRTAPLMIGLGKKTFAGAKLSIPLQSAENSVVAVALGLGFTTDDGGSICDRRYYAARIVEIVNIVDGEIVQFRYPDKASRRASGAQAEGLSWEMEAE